MRILYTLHFKQKNGQVETSQKEFNKPILVIGRGANCDINLHGSLISLQHARFNLVGNELFIEDLKSFSGTRVESELIQNKRLSDGDAVSIGESVFTINKRGSEWHINENREAVQDQGEEVFVAKLLERLDVKRKLPTYFFLSILFSLFVLLAFFVYPVLSGNMNSWSSGPISNVHSTIANDCSSCHAAPFEKIKDSSCLSCHNMSDHIKNHKIADKHIEQGLRCGSCHMEHNGKEGLVIKNSKLCVSCHANPSDLVAVIDTGIDMGRVISFEQHPEFRITQDDKNLEKTKVALTHLDAVIDTNTLRLNHKVHLEAGLMGPEGPVNLRCDSCHQLADDNKSYLPVAFEKDCSSCHELSFEEFSTSITVPHETPDNVYESIRYQYALLFLQKDGKMDRVETNRAIPKGEISKGLRAAYAEDEVNKRSRVMESQIFKVHSCSICHDIQEKSEPIEPNGSRFVVTKPETPTDWMPGAVFNHRAHQNIDCVSCHSKARDSESTSDVMLPQIKVCQECHHDTGKGKLAHDSRVLSECVMCHVYHEAKPLQYNKRIHLNVNDK
jgi:predicted CXXCH cytochrome family protein